MRHERQKMNSVVALTLREVRMVRLARLCAVLLVLTCIPAAAEQNGVLRIGVLNDMSSVYADFQGPGSVIAAQLAVEDFAKQSKRKVEVLSADHQNKPDVGSAIARRWFDTEGVDMIVDLPNSAVALAVAGIAREKNKVVIGSGAGTALLTGASCSPNTVHWTYDTWAMGHGLARGVLQQGGKTWFFITADYAFGHDLEKQATEEIVAGGGKVLGAVRHPIANNDFSSFLLQAQASGAEVIAFANAGGDTVNSIKQAAEYKLGEKQKIVALIFDLQSVPALGLATAQGLTALNAFYWDVDDATRAWAKRFQDRHGKKMMPNHMHAGRVFRDAALPERRRQSRLAWRRRGRGGGHESRGDGRSPVRPRQDTRGWAQAASDASAASQDAGRVQRRVGRLQDRRHHRGGQGLPAPQGRRLSAHQIRARDQGLARGRLLRRTVMPSVEVRGHVREVRLGAFDVTVERRRDGVLLVHPQGELGPYPAKVSAWLEHWARVTPDSVFLAQREADGAWRTLTYASVLGAVRRIGAALLARNLSAERPVAILSGNDIEHALVGLAAMYVGVAYAPISPAYSLMSADFGKLRAIIGLLTPGLVFVNDGTAFARAVSAAVAGDVEVVVARNPVPTRSCTQFSALSAEPIPSR